MISKQYLPDLELEMRWWYDRRGHSQYAVVYEGIAPRRRTRPSLSRSVITGLAAGRYLNSLEYL